MSVEIKALSVSKLTQEIKSLLENEPIFQSVVVEGEISNFKLNSSGHIYFTLKDEGAQISAVMFKWYSQSLSFKPKDGDKVYVKGSIKVYEKGGNYQILVTAMKEKGLGDLYQKYEELKRKLEGKGYFKSEHKKPLPMFPKNIALLTSQTGAVIEDLKTIILKRSRFSNLTLYPTKVQGDDAKYNIVKNIELANKNDDIDVIILARGGGSIEDLWPFNEEIVADAIYNSKKPIISAIGHETDFTISDFTADLRAATPSDAALIVVRDNKDLENELNQLNHRFKNAYQSTLNKNIETYNKLSQNIIFKEPSRILYNKIQSLTNLSLKLDNLSPKSRLEKEKEVLNNLSFKLNSTYKNLLNKDILNYKVINEKLSLLNPLSVLDKGYSITFKNDKIIKSSNDIEINDEIKTRVKNGIIYSKVLRKE